MPILILMLFTLLISGCDTQEHGSKQPVTRQPKTTLKLMQQSITAPLFELPSQAPEIWRQFKDQQPALVLFSEHPFLTPIPQELKKNVETLLMQGTAKDFYQHGSIQRYQPQLLPQQVLRAALTNHFFSEVIWYFPSVQPASEISATKLRAQMTRAGFLTKEEATKLQQIDEGIFEGEVQGVPLRIIHPLAALPEIERPIILHMDLGYFKGQFKNEISTPVYDILRETVQLLRDSRWDTLAVTLSASTENGNYSLASRFLMTDLAQMLKKPSLLDDQMPSSWLNRKEYMFSQNFFQEAKAQKLIKQSAADFPNDPSVQYDFYRVLIQTGASRTAFAQLDKVVTMDPAYAEEYLTLAETGQEKGWNKQTLKLLDKAATIYPQNPFILLQKADLLKTQKKGAEAQNIYNRLQKYIWSTYYYPTMPDELKKRSN